MVTLTNSAVSHFKNMIQNSGSLGIKLYVKKSGCSGYSYVLDLADDKTASSTEYQIFECDGLKLLVAKDSLGFVDGTEIDYVKDKFSGVVKFKNPNVVGECGCGESFSVGKK